MDYCEIRKRSMKIASELGYPVNTSLPLLEEESLTRTPLEIINRLLCLHVTAASAYGFDRSTARAWLQREGAWDALSPTERHFLNVGGDSANRFKLQVEAAWALAWALQLVSTLDFSKECDNTFVSVLPNLKISEQSEQLRENATLRVESDITKECDLAYCLHWAIRQAQLDGNSPPGNVAPYVIEERRRALEWLLAGGVGWDDVVLDT